MAGTSISPFDRPGTVPPFRRRLSRYDLLLGAVPAAFLLGLLAAGLANVPFRVAMGGAAAVGVLALVDGLFINPPRPPRAGDGGSAR